MGDYYSPFDYDDSGSNDEQIGGRLLTMARPPDADFINRQRFQPQAPSPKPDVMASPAVNRQAMVADAAASMPRPGGGEQGKSGLAIGDNILNFGRPGGTQVTPDGSEQGGASATAPGTSPLGQIPMTQPPEWDKKLDEARNIIGANAAPIERNMRGPAPPDAPPGTLGEVLTDEHGRPMIKPEYKLGIGGRILRGAADLASGGIPGVLQSIVNPAAPGYIGRGAVNDRYYSDEMERRRRLAGAEQLQTDLDKQQVIKERDFANRNAADRNQIRQAYEAQKEENDRTHKEEMDKLGQAKLAELQKKDDEINTLKDPEKQMQARKRMVEEMQMSDGPIKDMFILGGFKAVDTMQKGEYEKGKLAVDWAKVAAQRAAQARKAQDHSKLKDSITQDYEHAVTTGQRQFKKDFENAQADNDKKKQDELTGEWNAEKARLDKTYHDRMDMLDRIAPEEPEPAPAAPPTVAAGQMQAGGGVGNFADLNKLADAVTSHEGANVNRASNNNPGNIKNAPGQNYPTDKDGFRIFKTPEEGRAALLNQLKLTTGRLPANATLEDFVKGYLGTDAKNAKEVNDYVVALNAAGLGAPPSTAATPTAAASVAPPAQGAPPPATTRTTPPAATAGGTPQPSPAANATPAAATATPDGRSSITSKAGNVRKINDQVTVNGKTKYIVGFTKSQAGDQIITDDQPVAAGR